MKTRVIVRVSLIIILIIIFGAYVNSMTDRKHFSTEFVQQPLSLTGISFQQLEPISINNLSNIQEESTLPLEGEGAVIAISEGKEPETLQVVYESGIFTRWSLETLKPLCSQSLFLNDININAFPDILPVYKVNGGVSFNKDGSYLIVPTEINSTGYLMETDLQYAVWNLESLKQVYPVSGIARNHILYPTSDIVISASGSTASITFGFASDYGGGAPLVHRSQNDSIFTRLAVDPLGDFLAISDSGGNVLIGDISRLKTYQPDDMFNLLSPKTTYHLLGFPMKNVVTIDLKFDETHSWLAWLNDEKLVIWSLKNYIFPLHMNTKMQDANVMSFDHTGQVLAVATKNGIKIISVAEKSQIAEYRVGEVTALYFSRDNRLLIWGDTFGNVHLWGVK